MVCVFINGFCDLKITLRELKNDGKNGVVKKHHAWFSDFPTTVLTVSGSKGMLSVL
jgi:hypothetical protein